MLADGISLGAALSQANRQMLMREMAAASIVVLAILGRWVGMECKDNLLRELNRYSLFDGGRVDRMYTK